MTPRRAMGSLLMVGVFLSSGALSAQDTGANGDLRHGGFGGPVVKLTEIDGTFGVLVGGRGGWIIDGSVVIGGGGYALANGSSFDDLVNSGGEPGELEMAYGGLELGYIHRPEESMHVALGLLVGPGGVAWNPDGPSGSRLDDSFFVAEPEVTVVLNATRIFRVALGLSYRFARGVELLDLGDSELSGLAGVASFQFGSF